jgi:iron complex outermembrane receptor protein
MKKHKQIRGSTFRGKSFLREQNDHAGGNDGNNLQLDLNYGTGLVRESFINLQEVFIKRPNRKSRT